MDIKEAKKKVGNLWSYLFPKKEGYDWIKNSLGEIISKENIDSYIAELDLDSAKDRIKEVFNWESAISNGKKSWQDYFDTLDNGEDYIIDLIKNTDDLSKLTGEDLIKANQAARQSAIAHNAALKQQTLSAKAGQVALKGLALAGNIAANIGLSLAINAIITGLSNLVNSVNNAKEHIEQLSSEYKKAQSDLEDVAKKLEENEKLIDEINSNPLAITDENTLIRLENENAQLKAQYDYLKKIADLKKEELYKETEQFLNSTNQKGINTVASWKGAIGAAQGGNWGKAISDSNLGIASVIATILDSEKDLGDKVWDSAKVVASTFGGIPVWVASTFIDSTEEAISYLDQADEYIVRLNEIKDEYDNLDLGTEAGNNRKAELDKELDDLKTKIVANGSYLSKQVSEGNINESSETYSRITDIMQRTTEALNQFNDVEIDLSDTTAEIEDTGDSIEDLLEKSKVFKETLDNTFSNQSTIQSAFDKIQKGSSLSADEVRKLVELCPELTKEFAKTADGYTIDSDRLIEANERVTKNTRDSITERINALKEYLSQSKTINNQYDAQKHLESQAELKSELESLELVLSMLEINGDKVASTFEKLDESFSKLTSKAKTLSSALKEQDEAGTLSADTIMDIVDAGYASALVFDKVTGKVTLNKEAYLQLAKAEYDEQIANLETEKRLYQTYYALSDFNSSANEATGIIYGIASAFLEVQKSIADTPEQIAEIDARIAALKIARDNVGNYDTGTTSDSIKAAFEEEMKDIEHLHNMELISDEEYYDALETANENYYKDSLEKESEYNSNIEKIYNGRKNIYKENVDKQAEELENAYKKGFLTAKEYRSEMQKLAETSYGVGTVYFNTEFASENYDDLINKSLDLDSDIYEEELDELKKADDGSLESHQDFIEKWKKLAAKMFDGVDPKKYKEILDEIDKEEENFWNDRVEKEKEYWENQKQAVIYYYDNEIKKLEDIADEEERINKQEELRLNLIKAQQDLLNAKKNRNQLVFSNGGFEYTYDQEAVESASEAVKNAEQAIAENERKEEIELLKEQKANEEEYYDKILKIIQLYINKTVPLTESDKEVFDDIMNSPYAKLANQETQINPKADVPQTQSNESKDKDKNKSESMTEFKPDFSNLQRDIDYFTEITSSRSVENMSKLAKFVGEPLMQAAQYPMWGQSASNVYNNSTITNNDNKQSIVNMYGDIPVNVQGGTSDEMINEFAQKLSAALVECATREIYSKNKR